MDLDDLIAMCDSDSEVEDEDSTSSVVSNDVVPESPVVPAAPSSTHDDFDDDDDDDIFLTIDLQSIEQAAQRRKSSPPPAPSSRPSVLPLVALPTVPVALSTVRCTVFSKGICARGVQVLRYTLVWLEAQQDTFMLR